MQKKILIPIHKYMKHIYIIKRASHNQDWENNAKFIEIQALANYEIYYKKY